MAVTEETPIASSVANGVTLVFPHTFTLLDDADLVVTGTVDGVTSAYVLGADYTVSGVGSSSGSVTFGVAPASGVIVTRYRDIALERATDYQDNGDLLADNVNLDFDRLWFALQDIFNGGKVVPTCVRAPNGETLVALPPAAARAGYFLGFDGSGQPTLLAATADTAAALAADLALSSNASKGDALIGVKKTATGAVGRTQHTVNNDSKSLRDFGAVGDGTTDDTAAFQAAIDSGVPCIEGVPGDTYLINGLAVGSPTSVGSGVRYALYYSGTASFEFIGNGATIKRTDITYGTGVDEYFKIITTGSVKFSGWTFEGHGTPGSTVGAGRPIQYVFHLETANGSRITNNRFLWGGITELYGCTDTWICDNLYEDTSGITNTFKHGASTYTDGLRISGNRAYRSEFDVIDLNDATRNFVITDNYLEDANYRDYTSDSIDYDEFIDVGGTSLPVYNGIIANNVLREATGRPTRGIYLKQYSSHIIIANNVLSWDAGSKRAENDGITLNFAGDEIQIIGNQITGFDAGITVRNNPNGSNYVIKGNIIRDVAALGIYVNGFDSNISGNHISNSSGSLTGTLYGIRVDDPGGCTIVGNQIDLNAATGSIGIYYVGTNSLNASSVKDNTIRNCGLGIRHFGGSASYVGNNIQRCYGSAFNATNGGKSVKFSGNYMADNWRSSSPLTVQSLLCTYTIEIAEIVYVQCNDNMIAENDLNTERGTVRLSPGGGGYGLVAIGNYCTNDTSARAITSPTGYVESSTGNNIPTYAIVP